MHNINTCVNDSAAIVVPETAPENSAAQNQINDSNPAPAAPDQIMGEPEAGTEAGEADKPGALGIPAPVAPSDSTPAPLESRVEPPVVQVPTIAKIVSGMVALDRLKPHPKNNSLYGEEKVDDLVDSILKFGIQEPFGVTPDGTIFSGHRRHRAAPQAGLKEVPVRVVEFKDDLELSIALLEHNRQRVKSKKQIAREFQLRLQIEKELGKRRQATNVKKDGQQVAILPPAATGKARDAAGEAVGISGRTGENSVRVLDTIERLQAEGKFDEAKEIEDKLESSFDGAYQLAIKKGHIKQPGKANAKKSTKATQLAPVPPAATPATTAPPEEPPPAKDVEELPPAEPVIPAPVEAILKAPAPKKLDSDGAIELADKVLKFLRSRDALSLTKSQKQSWSRLFSELETCRATLGITKLTTR